MQENKLTFLVTFLVNVTHQKSGRQDQVRPRIGLVQAMDEADARRRIEPLAKGLGATFALEPIDLLERLEDIPQSVHRYCKKHGFDVILINERADGSSSSVPNCS